MSELVPYQASRSIAQKSTDAAVPALVVDAGEDAVRRFLEFFAATIRNKNTRVAYYNDVRQFFAWCESRGIDGLERIEPIHVALYVEELILRSKKAKTFARLSSESAAISTDSSA